MQEKQNKQAAYDFNELFTRKPMSRMERRKIMKENGGFKKCKKKIKDNE